MELDFFKFFDSNGGGYPMDQVTLAKNQIRANR